MSCGYVCFAYLSNVFALTASASTSGEVVQFPQRDQTTLRAGVAPSIALSVLSRRTQVNVSYRPAFGISRDQAGDIAQKTTTLDHRFALGLSRAFSAQTQLSIAANAVTGTFDAIGLRGQLASPTAGSSGGTDIATTSSGASAGAGTQTGSSTATNPGAGAPVGGGAYHAFSILAGLNTTLSKQWSVGATADSSFTEPTRQDAAQPGALTNVQLIGKQFRAGVGARATYALTSRLALQSSALAGYQFVGEQRPLTVLGAEEPSPDSTLPSARLLSVSLTAGTSVAIDRTTQASIAAGFANVGPWFGESVPHRFRAGGAMASAGLSRQLTTGRNAVGFDVSLSWSPTYDPITNSVRFRLSLTSGVKWTPAKNWRVALNALASVPTDGKKGPDVAVGNRNRPSPETRVSLSLPVTYTVTSWSRLDFGARSTLAGSALGQDFELVDPDYAAFLSFTATFK